MKKLMSAAVLATALLTQVVASHAVVIDTIHRTAGFPAFANDFFFPGVLSDNGRYSMDLGPGFSTVNDFGPVGFGTILTNLLVGPPTSDTFTNVPAAFAFTISVDPGSGPIERYFIATGTINASISTNGAGGSSGSGQWVYNQLDEYTSAGAFIANVPITGPTLSPSNDPTRRTVNPLVFGNIPVFLWIDQQQQLPVPGSGGNFSIDGFVTSVPEPGAVAMMVGMGLVGSSVLVRRRRRA